MTYRLNINSSQVAKGFFNMDVLLFYSLINFTSLFMIHLPNWTTPFTEHDIHFSTSINSFGFPFNIMPSSTPSTDPVPLLNILPFESISYSAYLLLGSHLADLIDL